MLSQQKGKPKRIGLGMAGGGSKVPRYVHFGSFWHKWEGVRSQRHWCPGATTELIDYNHLPQYGDMFQTLWLDVIRIFLKTPKI